METLPRVGRYVLHRQIARGGMATIHIARLMGDEGFSRIVAAKRVLPELAENSELVAMLMDEARVASKVHHRNVVPVLDLVTTESEVMLVQEYVHGVPLHVLMRSAQDQHQRIPVRIAASIATEVLAGLHAAHTTVDEMGTPLGIVHRDVSPHNVMLAVDGSARLLDFGIAKTTLAAHATRAGAFKGKLAYSAPEHVQGMPVQQSDIYSLAVILWELLVGHRMHANVHSEAQLVATIVNGVIPSLTDALANEADWGAIDSTEWRRIAELEPIVMQGLAREVGARFATAEDMERAIHEVVAPASAAEVAAWVRRIGKDFLDGRDKIIAAEEQSWRKLHPHTTRGPRATQAPDVGARTHSHVAALDAVRGGGRFIGTVLAALVLLVGVGVVFAMQAADEPTPAQLPVTRDERTPIEVIVPPQPQLPAPVQTLSPKPTPPGPRPPVVRSRPRASAVPTPRPVPPAPAPVPVPDASESTPCSPPYYFEGEKKVFKPQCL